ncbi:MAG: 2-oxo-4-hydroxy-4-carboxy-5-ureidoimidazoline decarboxylase [Bacteroidetes bacterium]|nr:2-oxo-4-hydroxy-4-carboxy-5-ureidoimidazoline decarboxylase [Bacteroidota bacterium]
MRDKLKKCCGSENWVTQMLACGSFNSYDEMITKSEEIWFSLTENDWLEAFKYHPKIGDLNSLKKKYSHSKDLSEKEQSGTVLASENTLKELAEYNEKYEKKFGFIFIVFATGKSAEEMLEIIKSRISNDIKSELKTAALEQSKITNLRLKNYYESDYNTRS